MKIVKFGDLLKFFLGIILGLAFVGTAVYLFLVRPASNLRDATTLRLELPQGKGIGYRGPDIDPARTAAVPPPISSKVKIQLGPHVQSRLKNAASYTLTVELRESLQGTLGGVAATRRFSSPEFPLDVTLSWNDAFRSLHAGKGIGDLRIQAFICSRPTQTGCSPPFFHGLSIQESASIDLSDPSRVIDLKPVLVMREVPAFQLDHCFKNGSVAEGKLVASKRFLANFPGARKLLLVASPNGAHRLGAPFYGADARPATEAELRAAVEKGLMISALTLSSEGAGRFVFRFKPGLESAWHSYFAVVCGAEESELSCAGRASPLPTLAKMKMRSKEREMFRLVPRGFRVIRCGDTDAELFLDDWNEAAAPATPELLLKSSPPELTEGLFF